MNSPRSNPPRVSLTKKQLEEGVGAELFSLCQGITADGKLSKDELVALTLWLRQNKDADLPGITLLTETINRILADGRVTHEEQRELLEAIEKVLPPDARKNARAARKTVERQEKAAEKAAREAQRRREIEEREKRDPEDEFDFMVAGVQFEGRHRLIARHLNVGDRVGIKPELDNPKDDCAVAITLADGRQIGYVPRTDSEDVTGCIEDLGYYVATIKKILTGRSYPVPVVVLQFYRSEQLNDIGDLDPWPCPNDSHSRARKPWWRFW